MKYFIYLILFSSLITSCNKDKVPSEVECEPIIIQNHSNDTVFPSPYLMAYPGSWWEYDNGFLDSCEYWQSVPIRETISENGCLYVDEDMWILPEPLYLTGTICYDSGVTNPNDYSSTTFYTLVDTIVGVFYEHQGTGGQGQYSYDIDDSAETIARLDSMTIGGNTYYDVLHTKRTSYIYYHHLGGGPNYVTHYWFAKNVGKIKWHREVNGSLVEEAELVDYFIAPY